LRAAISMVTLVVKPDSFIAGCFTAFHPLIIKTQTDRNKPVSKNDNVLSSAIKEF